MFSMYKGTIKMTMAFVSGPSHTGLFYAASNLSTQSDYQYPTPSYNSVNMSALLLHTPFPNSEDSTFCARNLL